MRIKQTRFYWLVFFFTACQPIGKSEVASILEIAEPKEWILVIHPEGCKTCLESFYSELMNLPKNSPGAIVILAKNSKSLRINPIIGDSPIPLYLDEQKLLIQEGLVKMTDQILLFRGDEFTSFDILDYERVLSEIR
ncbi:MAG: hypothetical protein ACQEW9_11325 [Bacteroidota bacterium]|uniref:Uncharacterized protein n=1 Tax=Algoriphagus faecimaris TaxID=686796 RepID=A0A1G6QKH3_9BACT|nr:hypothetical protein [Algoriphagus faecimaris]SDC92909.1 hypothetical protein SAMN04488104_1009122 [Algoriphagus faecimaris]